MEAQVHLTLSLRFQDLKPKKGVENEQGRTQKYTT